MQLVGRVTRNGFGAVGKHNRFVEGSINGRVGPRAGIYLLLMNPFIAFRRLAEGNGARGVPVDVEHGVVACARTFSKRTVEVRSIGVKPSELRSTASVALSIGAKRVSSQETF